MLARSLFNEHDKGSNLPRGLQKQITNSNESADLPSNFLTTSLNALQHS